MYRIIIKGKVGAIKMFVGDKVDIGSVINIDGIDYEVYKKSDFQGSPTLYVQ